MRFKTYYVFNLVYRQQTGVCYEHQNNGTKYMVTVQIYYNFLLKVRDNESLANLSITYQLIEIVLL